MIDKAHWQRYSIPLAKRAKPRWAYLTVALLAAGLTSWLGFQISHAFWVLNVYDNIGDLSPGITQLLETIGWTAAGLASLGVMVWSLRWAIRPARGPET
jgi:TRAP-type C4-dicarboxylate transport system permease small subunit